MTDKQKPRKVPAGRVSRLLHFGGLASAVAGNILKTSSQQLLKGERPSVRSTVLSSDNALSISSRLANMRGAAMKVGQLLSMDAGEILPKEWEPILARLRQQAKSMPKQQLLKVLQEAWGDDWHAQFKYFSFEPVAAASIGQVHKATLQDGTELAIKVQYPGVKQSINSDIDNIASLIRVSGVLPKHIDITPLLSKAKAQLHDEADYIKEAQYLKLYTDMLGNDAAFSVPFVLPHLSNQQVLCMQYMHGQSIESLAEQTNDSLTCARIDKTMHALFRLLLQELFDAKLMQSDPNFANYRYDPSTRKIVLLDFGACQHISDSTSKGYLDMARAMQNQDRSAMQHALSQLGLIDSQMPKASIDTILDACLIASECLQTNHYNLKNTQLIQRIQTCTMPLVARKQATAVPQFDVALVNRKVSGMVLLANKLGATLDLKTLLANYLHK